MPSCLVDGKGLRTLFEARCQGLPLARRTPKVIKATVYRQPVQPGAEGGPALEGRQLVVRLQEDLLKQIFRLFSIAYHSQCQVVNARAVPAVDRLEGVQVALLTLRYQIGLLGAGLPIAPGARRVEACAVGAVSKVLHGG